MKELEDYPWFPSLLRQYQMDFIGFMVCTFNIYKPFVQYLNSLKTNSILFDLCSGTGKPAIHIFKQCKKFNHLILSDKFPNTLKDTSNIIYLKPSVDVLSLKFEPQNTYIMLNAFHHFSDIQQLKITEKVKENNAQLFIVEILEPSFICFIKILFATTIGVLLFTPFIKPFSLKKWLFTYIIPINIFTICFDGLVSVIKSKNNQQYQKLLQQPQVNVLYFKNYLASLTVIHIHPHV